MNEQELEFDQLQLGMELVEPPVIEDYLPPEIPRPMIIGGISGQQLHPGNEVYEDRVVRVFEPGGETAAFTVNPKQPLWKVRPADPVFLAGLLDIPPGVMVVPGTSYAGSDPEVFAVRADGTVLPAWEYLPGKDSGLGFTTHANTPVGSSGYAYFDGFQAEFTVEPGHCHGYLTDRVRMGLRTVLHRARAVDPGARLTIDSAVRTPREVLMVCPPERCELGCAPSQNIYGSPRLAVPDTYELEWRFAGAHLHYGTNIVHEKNLDRVVKLLDAVAGVVNVAMGGKYNVPQRRRYYGRAGEYRWHPVDSKTRTNPNLSELKKVSRLEYRTPDTILLSHPAPFNFFVDLARGVMKIGAAGYEFLWHAEEDEVRAAINQCDVGLARKILGRNEKFLRTMVRRCYNTEQSVITGMRLVMDGIESVVQDPQDVCGNWMLDATTATDYGSTDQTLWHPEGIRSPSRWPTGKWWASASELLRTPGRML